MRLLWVAAGAAVGYELSEQRFLRIFRQPFFLLLDASAIPFDLVSDMLLAGRWIGFHWSWIEEFRFPLPVVIHDPHRLVA